MERSRFTGRPAIADPNHYANAQYIELLACTTLRQFEERLALIFEEINVQPQPLPLGLKMFEYCYCVLDLQRAYANHRRNPGSDWTSQKLVAVHRAFLEVTAPYAESVRAQRMTYLLQHQGAVLLTQAYPGLFQHPSDLTPQAIAQNLPNLDRIGGPHG